MLLITYSMKNRKTYFVLFGFIVCIFVPIVGKNNSGFFVISNYYFFIFFFSTSSPLSFFFFTLDQLEKMKLNEKKKGTFL